MSDDDGRRLIDADGSHGGRDRSWRQTAWVLATSLFVRMCVVIWAWGRIPPTADGDFYHRVAQRIAAGDGYTWLWPDGAVTYAAHYPVGYPALVGVPYALIGAAPGWAMVLNTLIGVAACVAAHRLLLGYGDRIALVGGAWVALHPALVSYTPALMTEGVTGALWLCAVWAAQRRGGVERDGARGDGARRANFLRLGVAGLVLGVATLVRPQTILWAPVVGVAAATGGWGKRLRSGALVAVLAVVVCAPWTLRNCERMGRCAFVSVNGGWNLLIGTQPEGRGAWSEIVVPDTCKAVYDEAGKDTCFGHAARQRIIAAPGAWLALLPDKLNVTFDYCGAGPWYLHQANGEAFSAQAKWVIGALETAFARLVLLLAIVGAWLSPASGSWRWPRAIMVAVALAFVVQQHAVLAYFGLSLLLLSKERRSLLDVTAAGAVILTAAIHAVFFGAGRYQLVLWPLLCAAGAAQLVHLTRAQLRLRFDELRPAGK